MQEADSVGALVDDMFFAAKIKAAVESAGRRYQRIKSSAELKGLTDKTSLVLIILDLNSTSIDPVETIRLIKAAPELSSLPVIGFVSHVNADLIRGAEEAGCDQVLPRSRFVQLLPSIASLGGPAERR